MGATAMAYRTRQHNLHAQLWEDAVAKVCLYYMYPGHVQRDITLVARPSPAG